MMRVQLMALEAETCKDGCDSKGLPVWQANDLGSHNRALLPFSGLIRRLIGGGRCSVALAGDRLEAGGGKLTYV